LTGYGQGRIENVLENEEKN